LNILFRTDSSSAIGTGHVFRCLALAEELVHRGHGVVFACRAEPGHLIEMIAGRHKVVTLPAAGAVPPSPDAEAAMIAESGAGPFDWCVVDHYRLEARHETALRRVARLVLAIDDLADRAHDCDLLLDTSHLAEDASVYDGLVSPRTKRLVGQAYVLLRRAFRDLAPAPATGDVGRILVSFGGNDPLGMTIRTVEVLQGPRFSNFGIDVTSSIANARLSELQAVTARDDRFAFHVDTPHFHGLVQACDLCIGAAGSTTWERFYLGKPALVATLAENQFAFARKLSERGLIRLLGFAGDVDNVTMERVILDTIVDRQWRASAARAGMSLIDGRGAERVAFSMECA
jgi:UDP-2,4-diacetamido-2,4,6-trideoxy-beta-L-altropyranose hydrolase